MLNRLARMFSAKDSEKESSGPAVPSSTPAPESVSEHIDPGAPYSHGETVPRWPDPGAAMVAASPDQLIETQKDTIHRIRGFSPLLPSEFESLVMPVFRRYAEWVHLLPASEDHHHSGPGGLLAHGFEVALHAARLADGRQVGIELTPAQRAAYQPRWKVATMLGGLFHDLGKPLVDCGATDPDRTMTWSANSMSLYAWLQANKLTHYRFYWRPGKRHERHKPVGTAVTREIIGQELMDWLCNEPTQDVVNQLMMSIGLGKTASNLMSVLVHEADQMSCDADQKRMFERLKATGQGSHKSKAAIIMSEARKLMEANGLTMNKIGAHVFFTEVGCFASVTPFISAVRTAVNTRGISGMPANEGEYLEILVDTGFIVPAVEDTPQGQNFSRVWDLTVEGEGKDAMLGTAAIRVIQFREAELLFGSLPTPSPMKATVKPPFVTAADKAAIAESVGVLAEPQSAESALDPAAAVATPDSPVPPAPAAAPSQAPIAAAAPEGEAAATGEPSIPFVANNRNRGDRVVSVEDQRRRDQFAEERKTGLKEAMSKLENSCLNGVAFREIINRIASRRLVWNTDAFETNDGIVLRMPGAFDKLGVPAGELLTNGDKANLIVKEVGAAKVTTERDFPSGKREKCVIMGGQFLQAWKALVSEHPEVLEGKPVLLDGHEQVTPSTPAPAQAPSQQQGQRPGNAAGNEGGNGQRQQQRDQRPQGNQSGAPQAPNTRQGQVQQQSSQGGPQAHKGPQGQAPSGGQGTQRPSKPERPVVGAAPSPHRDTTQAPRENILATPNRNQQSQPANAQQAAAPTQRLVERPASANKANGQGGSSLACDRIEDLTPSKREQINGFCWLVIQRAILEGRATANDTAAIKEALIGYAKKLKVRNPPLIDALSNTTNPAFVFKKPDTLNPKDIVEISVNDEYQVTSWVTEKLETIKSQVAAATAGAA